MASEQVGSQAEKPKGPGTFFQFLSKGIAPARDRMPARMAGNLGGVASPRFKLRRMAQPNWDKLAGRDHPVRPAKW